MARGFLKKVGIPVLALACVGGIVLKYNSINDNNVEASVDSEVNVNDELENTYIDDGYETPSEEELEDIQNKKEDIVEESVEDEYTSEKVESENNKENETSKVVEKTGVFQGFADSNFIEVKLGNEYVTYQVSSEAKDTLSKKNIEDSITFTISNVNGRHVITSVK